LATSGSTDFNDTSRLIVRDALASIGGLQPGETPEHELSEYAMRQLNRMIKAWQAKGYNLWRATEGEITLVAGQQSYTMGGSAPDFASRPLRIEHMRYEDSSGTETPRIMPMSREEYFALPNKDSNGVPTQFYYDPQLTQGRLYIWQVPSTVNGEKIKFTYQRSIEDFDAATDNPDFPQEWLDALVKNLAFQLAPTVYPGQPQIAIAAKAIAEEALTMAEDFDREWGCVYFTMGDPNYR